MVWCLIHKQLLLDGLSSVQCVWLTHLWLSRGHGVSIRLGRSKDRTLQQRGLCSAEAGLRLLHEGWRRIHRCSCRRLVWWERLRLRLCLGLVRRRRVG